MNRESILEKLRALKNLESRPGSQGEAEAAAYAIAGIIDRYKLGAAELDTQNKETKSEIKTIDIGEFYKNLPAYKRVLLNTIARHFGVTVISRAAGNGLRKRVLIGFETDVEFTEHMYNWLVLEADNLAPKRQGKGYSQSWRLGFAWGISGQLDKSRKEILEGVPNIRCASIVLSKPQTIEDYMNEHFPSLRRLKFYSGFSDPLAYLDGKLQGENTHLGKRMRA